MKKGPALLMKKNANKTLGFFSNLESGGILGPFGHLYTELLHILFGHLIQMSLGKKKIVKANKDILCK